MENSDTNDVWYKKGWVWILAIILVFGIWYGWTWYHTRISPFTPQSSTYDCPSNKLIKGNSQSGIYHMPYGQYYDKTAPERCFATEQDAKNAGFRASKR